ncbi:hypothetical protein FRB94_011789 [Tulasnella sp. JGI-2019a]|nr:hypothetical protein FRB93_002237 [Tulasnella sp. JGI-2019a]KAG9014611.1 hypothetical protein FRB94_011789 [Tulasnella sp. JGI-2019a]KAG9038948.1 hypothetical protein FRB95_013626 [Tulasnella sp. JGI-2019a]
MYFYPATRKVNRAGAPAKKAASRKQGPEDMDEIEDGASDEEASNGSQNQLQALLQAVEVKDSSKANSRASALSRKINGFHDAALAELAKKEQEASELFDHVDQHIASVKAVQADADWQLVATMFGTRAKDVRELVAGFDNVLEANGPKREAVIESISAGLEKAPQARVKSRKRLMKTAKSSVGRFREQEKVVTDAQALIKACKNMIHVTR